MSWINILTLIFSFLSVVFIFLSYFGIKRYILLHLGSGNKIIEKYNELDSADEENKTIIGMYVNKNRINKIKPVILSLLDQTVKVDNIILVADKDADIPSNYSDIVSVIRCGKNYGDTNANACIPLLLKENDNNTRLLIVEDNIIYGKDFVENIIEEFNKNPSRSLRNKNTILVIPEFFKSDLNRCSDNTDWLDMHLTSNMENFKYKENYKSWKK